MTKRTNTRRDFTQVAFAVVQEATSEAPSTKPMGKKMDYSKKAKKKTIVKIKKS